MTALHAPPENMFDILFIGSSFLAYGETDVVATLVDFAARGGKAISTQRRILSGYRLERHVEDQKTLSAIRSKEWDCVILQGTGLYLAKEEWHPRVFPHLAEFTSVIRERSPEARIIYMMPWAFKDGLLWLEGETLTYTQMQEALIQVAADFADSLAISVAPVGLAWHQTILAGYENDLFFTDNSHQSTFGAYLTACVFYVTLFQEPIPAVEFPNRDGLESYQPLNDIAYTTVIEDRERWNIH
ncbi:MAG: hypothetical protein HOC74_01415 [Gemmatimonadetes bacterium]|nr:hypothetical protein [Gemmatimonadota bacterium]